MRRVDIGIQKRENQIYTYLKESWLHLISSNASNGGIRYKEKRRQRVLMPMMFFELDPRVFLAIYLLRKTSFSKSTITTFFIFNWHQNQHLLTKNFFLFSPSNRPHKLLWEERAKRTLKIILCVRSWKNISHLYVTEKDFLDLL